jgi:riboflavin kinase / FMN adenylyltransferase
MSRAVAIGNFDGAHRGHAALVMAARSALGEESEVIALTFEPHPARYFRPDANHFRLMPQGLRARALESIGFDGALVLPFNADLAGMSAEDFVARILMGMLKADLIVVGADFHFGKDRAGTPAFLKEAGARHGFEVLLVPQRQDETGAVISSSAIRKALSEGDVLRANTLLGREFAVLGTVIHGAKRGRELGYPTANIALDPGIALKHGVYAVRVLLEGETYAGAASFGTRPQFDDGAPLLEVHLLDFAGDLYDKALEVRFVAYLREEAKFDSLEALLVQMARDCEKARMLLLQPPAT